VSYDLRIFQDYGEDTNQDTDGRSYLQTLRHRKLSLDGASLPFGGKLTLMLDDGRKLDFQVPSYGVYLPIGDFY